MDTMYEIPSDDSIKNVVITKEMVDDNLLLIDKKEAEVKMISEKQMGGVQLISYRKGELVDDYETTAVPRFMVFDRKGNVVTTDAPRPSEPKLKRIIEDELHKK